MAQVQSLVQELLHAVGTAKKQKDKVKNHLILFIFDLQILSTAERSDVLYLIFFSWVLMSQSCVTQTELFLVPRSHILLAYHPVSKDHSTNPLLTPAF